MSRKNKSLEAKTKKARKIDSMRAKYVGNNAVSLEMIYHEGVYNNNDTPINRDCINRDYVAAYYKMHTDKRPVTHDEAIKGVINFDVDRNLSKLHNVDIYAISRPLV